MDYFSSFLQHNVPWPNQVPRDNPLKRILVVGLTGAGKSTLIYNACTKQLSELMIHSGAKGNPMECREYEDYDYVWCDTAGFGEAKCGAWNTGTAIIELIRFLKKRRDGFHLAIFVARRGRVTEELHSTYEIFTALLPEMTPRVLIYTQDMFDYGTDKWFYKGIAEVVEEKDNCAAQQGDKKSPMTNCEYLEKNKMVFKDALGVDFPLIPTDARINDRNNAKERQRISQSELRSFVRMHCSQRAVPLYSTKTALRRLFENVLKVIVFVFTLNYQQYEPEIVKWFKKLGMTDEKVHEAVQMLEND